MRARAVVREAVLNTTSGTTRTGTLAVVLALVVVLTLGTEILTVRRLEQQSALFRDSGAAVLTLTASGRVDAQRCEALGRLPGVRTAGAVSLVPDRSITPAVLPDAPIPLAHVSPGFPLVQASDPDGGPGIVLSAEAAEVLAISQGQVLATRDGPVRVAGVYDHPRDGRRTGFGYLALDPRPAATTFDECWVDAWPLDPTIRSLLRTTLTSEPAVDGESPVVAQLNTTLGESFDGDALYHQRLSRYSGLLAGLAAVAVGFASVRLRRLQLAAALHDQVARRHLWCIVLLETTTWVVPAMLLGLALASMTSSAAGWVIGARITLPVALGAVAGVSAAVVTTRERHLFRYARDR